MKQKVISIVCILIGLGFCFLLLSPIDKESQLRNSYEAGIAKRDEGLKGAAEAAYNLGLLKEVTVHLDEARDYYKQALELNPRHKKAREALDKLEAKLNVK